MRVVPLQRHLTGQSGRFHPDWEKNTRCHPRQRHPQHMPTSWAEMPFPCEKLSEITESSLRNLTWATEVPSDPLEHSLGSKEVRYDNTLLTLARAKTLQLEGSEHAIHRTSTQRAQTVAFTRRRSYSTGIDTTVAKTSRTVSMEACLDVMIKTKLHLGHHVVLPPHLERGD